MLNSIELGGRVMSDKLYSQTIDRGQEFDHKRVINRRFARSKGSSEQCEDTLIREERRALLELVIWMTKNNGQVKNGRISPKLGQTSGGLVTGKHDWNWISSIPLFYYKTSKQATEQISISEIQDPWST